MTLPVYSPLACGGGKLLLSSDFPPTSTSTALLAWQAWRGEGLLPVQLNKTRVWNDGIRWASLQDAFKGALRRINLTFDEGGQEINGPALTLRQYPELVEGDAGGGIDPMHQRLISLVIFWGEPSVTELLYNRCLAGHNTSRPFTG